MIFAVAGLLKTPLAEEPPELSAALNEHLGPGGAGLRLAGYLRDREGRRVGLLGLIEAESFERAERFLRESPFSEADLYDRTVVAEYFLEVGRLD
jgi:hypothetical protein